MRIDLSDAELAIVERHLSNTKARLRDESIDHANRGNVGAAECLSDEANAVASVLDSIERQALKTPSSEY